MPFFGFLGGVVLAAFILVLLSESTRCRAAGRSLDWLRLPWPAYGLASAYAALFVAMWAYYFDGDLTRMKAELPDAEPFHILRGYLFQLESGDFIITLLAFLCGGLAVAALARAGRGSGDNRKDQAAQPQGAGAEGDQDGLGSAALRQLRRITALNTLLVFALFLFTLPALLPWIERRLSIVKLGDFEAHLVPLADKSRGTSSPDTPALYAKEHLRRWLMVSSSISRTIKLIETAPELSESHVDSLARIRFNYESTNRLFAENIIPKIARLYCMSVLAGVEPATVPGVREASSAFMTALQNRIEQGWDEAEAAEILRERIGGFPAALLYLRKIEDYYDRHYQHLTPECHRELNNILSDTNFDQTLTYKNTILEHRRGRHDADWGCGSKLSAKVCYNVLANGYTIRLITELFKISGGKEGDSIQLMLVEDGWLSSHKYQKSGLTQIDRANLQATKIGYMTNLHYDLKELIREYAVMKDIAIEIVSAISETCSHCSGKRKSKLGLKDEFEAYRRIAIWYMDADAVMQIGATMLRRISMNKLDDTDRAALRALMDSAIESRDEIDRGLVLVPTSMAARDRWAIAMLDEGIATIRYVQLVEGSDASRDEHYAICASARSRLEWAAGAYEKLSVTSPEHRFNRMRAGRTLSLVNQYCGET